MAVLGDECRLRLGVAVMRDEVLLLWESRLYGNGNADGALRGVCRRLQPSRAQW
jgi:hypothetical protein